MAITNDWEVNFIGKIISHVDGSLDYNGVTTGAAPEYGDYIRGTTSGTVGKIINGTVGQTVPDVSATGTVVLTNVSGRFEHAETLRVLDMLPFDTVTNGGFQTGDTLTTSTGASVVVDAIEYHYSQYTPTSYNTTTWPSGFGQIYGRANSTAFANNDVLLKSSTQVATVDTTTIAYAAGDAWTGAAVNESANGTISPPSGSRSVIINFDNGAEAIPRFAKIQDTNTVSPTRTATVQKVYGVTATGSLRLVDVSGTWANNNDVYVNKLPYDTLGSTSFKVGDKIVTKSTDGGSVQGSGKVIVVQTLSTANSGKLTLQNMSGTFNDTTLDNYYIYVRTTTDTAFAQINAPNTVNFYDAVASVNGAEITEHLASQGGLYATTDGLNVVRDGNALYTFLQDTFDDLGALDDTVPMTAQVALQQFTLVNNWKIPDYSFRLLESGSIQDSSLDNIWTNYQTIGSVEGIGNTVYAAITPLPLFYIAQGSTVLSTFWITGHMDVLIKVKTNTRTDVAVSSTGALVTSGTVTIFNRNFGDSYDHFETTTIAGVAPVPLATANDLNNASGTHRVSFDTQTTDFTSGEEIRTTGAAKRGIITSVSDSGTTGTIDYILLTPSTNFADNDALAGVYSTGAALVTGSPTNLVAGYQTQIVVATIDGTIAGSGSTLFYNGEIVEQTTSGAKGIMMRSTGGTMTLGNITGTFSNGNTITGSASGQTFLTSGAFSATSVIQCDIQDGNGPQPYNAVIYLDRDGDGSGDTLARMYEWVKYRTNRLELAGEPSYNLLGGPGSAAGTAGRLYITLDSTYALVKASPLGTFAGGTFFGARGVFVQNMASTDIRSYQLIDANGTVRNPPSLQSLTVTGLVSGDRVAVFRTTTGSIQVAEFAVSSTISASVNGSDAIVIEVVSNQRSAAPLPQDIPTAATVRVLSPSGSGLYLSFAYSSVARSTAQFTLGTSIGNVTTGKSLVAGNNAFVVLIEQEATSTSVTNSIIYVADIPILTRVRRKGILPFEVSGTFGSTGASVAAIRTFDSIVD